MSERVRSSTYMQWAKNNHATARYNLGVSGYGTLGYTDFNADLASIL